MGWIKSVVIVICAMMVLTGCEKFYKIDLTEKRRENLVDDLAFLGPRVTMEFPGPLTLDDVIHIGIENNLDLRISRMMQEISDDNAFSEKLKMLPQFNVDAGIFHRSSFLQRKYINEETGEVSLSNTVSQEKTQKTLDLTLSWNILDFGLSFFRARQAALTSEVRQMERIRQQQILAMDIATSYWKSVLSEHDLDYIREIEENMRSYMRDAEELVGQKRLDPIVAKEMQKQLMNLTISASDLQADISGIRIELSRLMGLTPTTQFKFFGIDDFEPIIEELPDPSDLNPERLEIISLRNRPELYTSDLKHIIQRDEARAAMVSMFPGLNFSGGYHYDDDDFLTDPDWFSVGIDLMTNLLSLPSKYANWSAQKKTTEVVRIQRVLLTAGIIAQVHVALHDYYLKEKQYRLQDESYRISKELFDMSEVRNRAGTIGFSDTVVTQRMLETMLARLERDRGIVELMNSYYKLLVTLGLGYDRWEEDLEDIDIEKMPVDNWSDFYGLSSAENVNGMPDAFGTFQMVA